MKINSQLNRFRIRKGLYASDESFGNTGAFDIKREYKLGTTIMLRVIADDGEHSGWEHVSVSLPHRCPNWDEMCFVKNLFWGEEETVIQFHPPKSQYVNNHPFCLHLWKQAGKEVELPPSDYVGQTVHQL